MKGDKQPEQTDDKEFKIIENIVITILRKSLFTHSYLICYGSYTNHIIHNVNYEDIDVYFPDSFFYLILIMFFVKMVSGLNLNILGYPFIKGHLALFYGDKKLIDCIYLNVYTLDKIRITEINGIKFIDPLFQFLNQIRINNELFRCNKIFQSPEKYEGILYSFLLYIKDRYKNFDLKKIREYRNSNKISDISYKMYGNNICLINIDKFIKFKCDGFDKLIIILSEPQVIITELDNIYGVYSIKYNAFLNEIFFETRENKGGFKNVKSKNIDRKVFETHTFSNIIDYNKRYLIMSNLTNTLYIPVDLAKKNIN